MNEPHSAWGLLRAGLWAWRSCSGTDMAWSRSAAPARRPASAAHDPGAGLIAGGDQLHVVAAASGRWRWSSTRLASAFNGLLLAGALYMAWIGYGLWRSATGLVPDTRPAPASAQRTFAGAALPNMLNPKAYSLHAGGLRPQFDSARRVVMHVRAAGAGGDHRGHAGPRGRGSRWASARTACAMVCRTNSGAELRDRPWPGRGGPGGRRGPGGGRGLAPGRTGRREGWRRGDEPGRGLAPGHEASSGPAVYRAGPRAAAEKPSS